MSRSATNMMQAYGTAPVVVCGHIHFTNAGATVEAVPGDDFSFAVSIIDLPTFRYAVFITGGPQLDGRSNPGYPSIPVGLSFLVSTRSAPNWAWVQDSNDARSAAFQMLTLDGMPPLLNDAYVDVFAFGKNSGVRP